MSNRMKVNERKCRLCDVLEDEYHCLVECPMYVKERKECLPESLRKKPSMFEFVKWMKDESGPGSIMLATLCSRVMKEHKKYL